MKQMCIRDSDTLLHPQFDAAALKVATPAGRGLGASPGAACGKIVFSAEDAEEWNARGEKVVLVDVYKRQHIRCPIFTILPMRH